MTRSKYHNRKITMDGEIFDSAKECNRWCELKLLEKGGVIKDLKRQVKFVLIPTQRECVKGKLLEKECAYFADFVYTDNAGHVVVEDVKGYRDPNSAGYAKFVIKRKLMLHIYGIRIREV
jgi:hypothetical protein